MTSHGGRDHLRQGERLLKRTEAHLTGFVKSSRLDSLARVSVLRGGIQLGGERSPMADGRVDIEEPLLQREEGGEEGGERSENEGCRAKYCAT